MTMFLVSLPLDRGVNATMEYVVMLLVSLTAVFRVAPAEDYELINDLSETEPSSFEFINGSDKIPGDNQGTRQSQYQSSSNLRVYKGPLPRFPGTTVSPWIALHSPVKMYIPIRNTGEDLIENEDCVQCPRNLIIQLPPGQKQIIMPVPTISLCSSFARRPGRVHVAVISGPRPGHSLTAGLHEVQLVVWKAVGTVYSCQYVILVREKRRGSRPTQFHVQHIPCPKPEQPSNGLLLCVPSDVKFYPHNSVCQFFCLDNYSIEDTSANSSTIICKNGKWSPNDRISCTASFCPSLPESPAHGSWKCNSAAVFRNGTHCNVSCAPGHVLETSQIENSLIVCVAPLWYTSEMIPNCKRAHLPKLLSCQKRHIIVKIGDTVKISNQLLPEGSSHSGEVLIPVCSLQGKNLPKGRYQNTCGVTDPELRTTRECSYNIHIEESSEPRPHPDECKNQTIFANKKGTIHSKPARFLVKIGEPSRTQVIRGSCTPRGELGLGSHFVKCKAIFPPTGSTGTCSYWIKVEERNCPPLKPIPNARIICESLNVGSVCYYECEDGYTFVDNQLIRSIKTCQPSLSWHPSWSPVCETETPKLVEGCNDLEVNATSPVHFVVPRPKFLTSLNETLNASCTPSDLKMAGHYLVECKIDEAAINESCQFNISILLEEQLKTTVPLEEELPKLVEGCTDIEVKVPSPVNFTVPLPRYVSSQNETLFIFCDPSFITLFGQHKVICSVDNATFAEFCYFNVTIEAEDKPFDLPSSGKVEFPELLEVCSDLEVNVSSPVNFTIPLSQYFIPQNRSQVVVCKPSYVTTLGQHQVECFSDNVTVNKLCSFNVTVMLEDESVTLFPLNKAETPELLEGCKNLEVDVSPPFNFTIPSPRYLTSQNKTFSAACQPSFLTITGHHIVKCSTDNFASCVFNVTVSLDESTTTASPEKGSCMPLSSPLHGSVQCSPRGQTEICQVTCDPGYGFPDDYSLTVICDGVTGLWDFQSLNLNGTLPDCFAQVEGSAVEVWVSFEAFSPHCEEELHEQMKYIVDDLCQLDTNCSKLFVNCTLDEESDMMLVTVNWTVQADFNNEEYLEHEEIPEAETRLETVLERTRAFLAAEDVPGGLHLFRDSFRRGLMTLVCPDGFTPDMMMANCVQCSEGNTHCK